MKKIPLLFLFLFLTSNLFAQLYSGPAYGYVESAVMVNTNALMKEMPLNEPGEKPVRNKFGYDFLPVYLQSDFSGSVQSDVTVDRSLLKEMNKPGNEENALLFKNFQGIAQTNSIPPDPYIAVGKNHIITTVNTSFRISDKKGKTILTMSADRFYSSTLSDVSAFDPKVIYDHFNERWVMVWLHQNDAQKVGYYLVSVSDDDDPTGVWYNWLLPSDQNGLDEVDNWGDYQGVGYDKDYIYLTSNNFSFGGSYNYAKIRVLKKSELYASNPGEVEWADFWNLKDQQTGGNTIFGIRPSRIYGDPGEYYFVQRSPYTTGDHMLIYKLKDPFGAPELTVSKITVGQYYNPGLAKQLGGGAIDLESGSGHIRNEPVYRDGVLHFVHSVASGSTNRRPYSSLRYLAIKPATGEVVSDEVIGSVDGYYYFYPAIAVDKDGSVVITYSRSADTEYAGAYYITKKAGSDTFSGSQLLEAGKGNYVKDFSSGRNRWGDYNGIWLDPVDENNFWMFTEYAAGVNTWGVKVGALRLIPFNGVYANIIDTAFKYTELEVGLTSDTKTVVIENFGDEELVISEAKFGTQNFKIVSDINFPVSVPTYGSVEINVAFTPVEAGDIYDVMEVSTNDPDDSKILVSFEAKGFELKRVQENNLYAVAKTSAELNILNPSELKSTALGVVGLSPFLGLTIDPKSGLMYGLHSIASASGIAKINSEKGDAHYKTQFDIPLNSIAFDKQGQLYGTTSAGLLYTIDFSNGTFTFVDSIGLPVSSMTINYNTDEMYVTAGANAARGKDAIYRIDKVTVDTVFVGNAGITTTFNAIVFGEDNKLYGATGSLFATNNLYSIEANTGAATLLGAADIKGIRGLAYMPQGVVSVENQMVTKPNEYQLKQNYPNPFNPSTSIEFALPKAANVKLAIYNLIGEEIKVLANSDFNAGVHKVTWNATSKDGGKVSSGIYFYRINAVDNEGREFSDTKKLILLK